MKLMDLRSYNGIKIIGMFSVKGLMTFERTENYMIIGCYVTHKAKVI